MLGNFLTLEVLTISTKELLINDEIKDKELRLIDMDGGQLGIASLNEAKRLASEKNLDLVLIAPTATPPVARIMDYGKFKFEQAKREKDAKKNQKVVELKEIKMSLNIDTHDFDIKVKQAIKFLQAGDKVKVTVRFKRAREMSHMNLCVDLMNKFRDSCIEFGVSEKPSKLEGRNYMLILSPKKV